MDSKTDSIHIPYLDITNHIHYIKRETYDFCKANNIEVEGIPEIVQGHNCYTITQDQLKELQKKLNYPIISVKVILNKKKERKQEILNIYTLRNIMYIDEDKYKDMLDKAPRKKIISKKTNIKYIQVHEEDIVKLEKKYLDDRINLQEEKNEINPSEVIELNIENKRIERIKSCIYNGETYIESILVEDLKPWKKIKVDGEYFIKVTPEDIDLFKILFDKKGIELNFIGIGIEPLEKEKTKTL